MLAAATVGHAQIVNVREATNLSLALAPSGDRLVIDLLGGLWQLPAAGGGAIELIPAESGIANPRFHRDGRRVVFQRWSGEQWDLWTMALDARTAVPLLATEFNEREPEFSADGDSVVFASDRSGHYCLWTLDLATGALRQLTDEPGDSSFPSVSDQGDLAYVNRSAGVSSLRLYQGGPRGIELFASDSLIDAPSWRPGGGVVVVNERSGTSTSRLVMWLGGSEPVRKALTVDEDVFVGRVAWTSPGEYLYAADGQLWRRSIASHERAQVHLFAGATVAPPNRPLVTQRLDDPGPHPVNGIVDPSASADGNSRVFEALGDLWLVNRRGPRRLTDDKFVELYPRFTADGESVVFAGDRGGKMDLWRLRLDNGVAIQLTSEAGAAYRPIISPSGKQAAFLVTEGIGPSAATELKLMQLDQPYRNTTVARDLYEVGTLDWLLEEEGLSITIAARVGRGGRPREHVYRILDGDDGPRTDSAPTIEPEDLPGLEWTAEAPEDSYVVQVGRVFDGIRNDYLRHMDIHVEGQRIAAIVRRGLLPLPDKVLDFSDATVIPGLIDTDAHHVTVLGERLGRLWLAYGVTTVREIGGNLSEAFERGESWASGRRAGPRLVIASDAEFERNSTGGIVVEAGAAILPSFAHSIAAQRAQFGFPELATAPVLPVHGAPNTALHFSALNRSYQDSLASLLETGRYINTGLAAARGTAAFEPSGNSAAGRTFARLYSPGESRQWSPRPGIPAPGTEPLTATLRTIIRNGGRVAVGSEAPVTPYGYGLHLELAELAAIGVPNDQVLRLASASAAAALGLDRQLGTLEKGKLADFVIIDGDPLARIEETLRIVGVVKGGVWRTEDELLVP